MIPPEQEHQEIFLHSLGEKWGKKLNRILFSVWAHQAEGMYCPLQDYTIIRHINLVALQTVAIQLGASGLWMIVSNKTSLLLLIVVKVKK